MGLTATLCSASSPTQRPQSSLSASLSDWRTLARLSPAGLARYCDPAYQIAPHIGFFNSLALQCARGEITNLAVSIPPQHGKSEFWSHYFPTWWMGTWQDESSLLASYEADYAAEWGEKCRDTIEKVGPELFGCAIGKPSRGDHWRIRGHLGEMHTAGAGGALTGKAGHLRICDDPIKNDAEARSPTIRKQKVEWFKSTFYTRRKPGGRCVTVVIQTRWHEEDVIGYLIKAMKEGGQRWVVVNLPAIAEKDEHHGSWSRRKGEALWEQGHSLAELEETRVAVGPYWWSAQYQGRPTPLGGGMLKRDWFRPVKIAPTQGFRWVRFWDLATSTKKQADYTVGVLLGFNQERMEFCIADVVRGRWEWPDSRKRIIETALRDGRSVQIRVEQVGFQLGAVQDLRRAKELVGFNFNGVPVDADKVARTQAWDYRAEAGQFSIVEGEWNADFLDEAELFPNGAHDDQVDGVSGAIQAFSHGDPTLAISPVDRLQGIKRVQAARPQGGVGWVPPWEQG